ncbi:MAG: methyltransferase domain-containing protein [Chitinivibrionales bacterium]|nr:methyltransferase domain-containing protein [Chitinivibrionales bacterium]
MLSYRLTFPVDPTIKERALGICYSSGMEGCQEEGRGDDVILTCWFNDFLSCTAAKSYISRILNPEWIKEIPVEDQDWNARWRESIQPVKVTDSIWVSPSWKPPQLQAGEKWIKLEPKMTFGTGHHETTRLVASVIEAERGRIPNTTFLDIGSGTGILCFIADCLGAQKCLGIEIDRNAWENIAENRNANPSRGTVDFVVGTLDSVGKKAAFDWIVMNMLRVHSGPLVQKVNNLLKPSGTFVWSGLLLVEKKAVIQDAGNAGFRLCAEKQLDEWWCGVFVHSGR